MVVIGAVSLLSAVGSALSCMICLPYPEKSAADYMLESDTVVFARENPQRPYTYAPVEVLAGRYDGGAIALLLDSTTKSALDLIQIAPCSLPESGRAKHGGRWG